MKIKKFPNQVSDAVKQPNSVAVEQAETVNLTKNGGQKTLIDVSQQPVPKVQRHKTIQRSCRCQYKGHREANQ